MKVAVIGGTGLIGSNLVQKLRARGHDALHGLAQPVRHSTQAWRNDEHP